MSIGAEARVRPRSAAAVISGGRDNGGPRRNEAATTATTTVTAVTTTAGVAQRTQGGSADHLGHLGHNSEAKDTARDRGRYPRQESAASMRAHHEHRSSEEIAASTDLGR